MLVLSRKLGEKIFIGDNICITVVDVDRGKIRLGIEAPRNVPIYRQDQWEPDVYPRYNPGPNAVRSCSATYVQEHRPSGTVITPRMNCYWRPG